MKIAVILPVGPLDRFGYQYNHDIVIENLCEFADGVFMGSTNRNRVGVDELLTHHPKLRYYADENTWFKLDQAGNEVWDVKWVMNRTNYCIDKAAEEGFDCALIIHINHYVPESNMIPLRQYCEKLVNEGAKYGWLYRKYQLANHVSKTCVRNPWIFNLRTSSIGRVGIGSFCDSSGQELARIQSGDFSDFESIAIVDAPMEQTLEDFEASRNFVRCYVELPGHHDKAVFEPMEFLEKYQTKFNAMKFSEGAFDQYGMKIAERTKEEFLSVYFMNNYQYQPRAKSQTTNRNTVLKRLRRAFNMICGNN